MNLLDEKMLSLLKELKESYHIKGVKAEFGEEMTTFEEALRLKSLASKLDLELTIKIGGCEAIKDLYQARTIGSNSIVAPMIESPYSMQKFLDAVGRVFTAEECQKMKFLINIETKYAFKCLDEILAADISKNLSGIVLGRTDLAGSLGLTSEDVNNEVIFDYAKSIAQKADECDKELIIGGGLSLKSVPFLKRIKTPCFTKFETRKIIFDAPKSLALPNIESGIQKALEFELLWIRSKQNYCSKLSDIDIKRMEVLENRFSAVSMGLIR